MSSISMLEATLERLRQDSSARLVAVIDIEALPIAISPQGEDASALTGRWAALMQSLAPLGLKSRSGAMEEMLVSGVEGEMIANRLGYGYWLLVVLEDKTMLGKARYAQSCQLIHELQPAP